MFIKKHWDIFSYLFFGGLTTLVNYLVYFLAFYWLGLSAAVSNVIAWTVAVVFAYLTNKPFVFKSTDWSPKVVLPELAKFISFRAVSGIFETAFIAITVDILAWNGVVMKVIASVVVIVLNYIASKLLVFKPKKV